MPSVMGRGLQPSRKLISPRSTKFARQTPLRNVAFNAPMAGNSSIDISQIPSLPHQGEPEFWRQLPLSSPFRDTTEDDFLSWGWNKKNVVETKQKLYEFLYSVVPEEVPRAGDAPGMQTRDEFAADIEGGIKSSTMSVRVMINWTDPANCPILRQFIPLKSTMIKDHPHLGLDSLGEQADSPVEGIVHRYPDKALFLPIGVCPVYCVFCTRSYGVGADTYIVKKELLKLSRKKLEGAFAYIESQENLKDIVVSGGDAFYLPHHILEEIGDRLIKMKNIERFRFATKGLAVAPNRFLDNNDPWPDALIRVADKAKKAGKLVPKTEHFRTPLQTILDMESQLRGSIAGFLTPNFVVDLPGGGGKRLACSFESYDRNTGVSTFRAPVLTNKGKEGKLYKYYDPLKPSS
ncbi:hypothetical protein O1611_g1350 [Lasiodiplodia mahajangana]|uniref:Uncharacterized protein n=1 Tax=Lasiodiplodia mahajangana TaxID=1108764 RepID=A0ACC2JXT4_9PEZI|nr:hypothetical protein O1611_g1350 [Lasiodiplodia mahajangana]